MNGILFISVSLLLYMIPHFSSAQFRAKAKPVNLYIINSKQPSSSARLLAAQTQTYNQIPVLSGAAAMPFGQTNSYWLTRMTTQSINQTNSGTNTIAVNLCLIKWSVPNLELPSPFTLLAKFLKLIT